MKFNISIQIDASNKADAIRQIDLNIRHLRSIRRELAGGDIKQTKQAKQSGVRGIVWDKFNQRWRVRLWKGDGVSTNVGVFRDLDDAILALAEAKKEGE